MKKRFVSILLMFVMVFSMNTFLNYKVYSTDINDEVKIEQVTAEMPDLKAYVNIENAQGSPEISATLGNEVLELVSVEKLGSEEAVNYFFLIDCSSSVSVYQMEAVKTALKTFATDMGSNESMTLITFGIAVETVLVDEKDKDKIISAIDSKLIAGQPGTLFYDALALASSEISNYDEFYLERKLAFVFSDSVDYNLGGFTKEEITELTFNAQMPVYAIGYDTGKKEELDNFGLLARSSGGDVAIVSVENLNQKFNEMILAAKDVWVASFKASSNIIKEPTQDFKLRYQNEEYTVKIPIKYSKADDVNPEIISVSQITQNSIELVFSETVTGANIIENYTIKNTDNDLLGIEAVSYDEENRTSTITFLKTPTTSTLSISLTNIKDVSMQENEVESVIELNFVAPTPTHEPEKTNGSFNIILITIALIIVGVIIAVAIVSSRKKHAVILAENINSEIKEIEVNEQNKNAPDMQIHFVRSEVVLPTIRFDVSSSNGKSKQIETKINKTLFVGRSDICEIYFDDTTMSRQHFVIGEDDGVYSITNLSQTSNTLLNGVPINNTRKLSDGDSITAGQQTLMFFSH